MRPTEDSGFEFVFAEKMRLTASDCASKREGLSVMLVMDACMLSILYASLQIISISAVFAIVYSVSC